MFEVRIKCSTPESRAAEEKYYTANPPSHCKCRPQPSTPKVAWIELFIFSIVMFAAITVFLCMLYNWMIIIPLTTLLWCVLVLCVRHNVIHLNSVDTLSAENGILNIRLANGDIHTYKTDDIKVTFRRVKNANKNRPIQNRHFKLTVTASGKKTEYDVLADDGTLFKAFVSNLQK